MWKNLVFLVLIFVSSLCWLYFLSVMNGPDDRIHFPSNLQQLKNLTWTLQEYKQNRPKFILVFVASAYLFKQTFAIPGSVFMNLLCGALFGVVQGGLLCCLMSATGATLCFLLSKTVAKPILWNLVPTKLENFKKLIEMETSGSESSSLFSFLLSLRIFPMTPNWLVNMASPIVTDISAVKFFISVLIGLAPYNFITSNAGETLIDLKSLDDILSWRVISGLAVTAAAVIGPTLILKSRARAKAKAF